VVTILFACVQNAGRSQMAAGFFRALADPARARAISAGTRPTDRVNPIVVEAMREAGVDVSAETPRQLTTELASDAQWLITMGCGDQCPIVPGVAREDWPLEDPADQPLDRVRPIRDEIHRRVQAWLDREQLRSTRSVGIPPTSAR
jgi:arsenate reductase (thioredoxin)